MNAKLVKSLCLFILGVLCGFALKTYVYPPKRIIIVDGGYSIVRTGEKPGDPPIIVERGF